MDPTDLIGKAPATTDPITWIAFLLVVVLVAVLLWQLRSAQQERRDAATERSAERENRDEALAAFRADLAAQRAHDASSVAATHTRIDGLATEVRALGQHIASRSQ